MSLMKRDRPAAWPTDETRNQDLVDTAFREMWHSFFGGEGMLDRLTERGSALMRVEEFVEDDTCVIRAELPGIDPEKDVDITVADGMLRLSAHREERTEDERPDGYRSEFRYGRMVRTIRLPEGATESDVTANYHDGILEVRVPAPEVAESPEPKKIPVSRS